MSETSPKLRAELEGIPTYKPGKPAAAGGPVAYKLSSNENPYPPLPGVMETVTAAASSFNRYPDMMCTGLMNELSERFGVPAGPLIAIWGMETGFGSFMGKEHTLSAVSTLAYDCRRSAYFTDQLYAALQLVERGDLSPAARGAAHGEIGQTQFLPLNVLKFGVDGDGNGHIDMVRSKADALASTANFLRGHGWQPGGGYQPGEVNFAAIQGWNAASVYQQAIAIIGAEIDGD